MSKTPAPGYVHGHHESVLRSHRSRTAANSAAYLLEHLRPGDRLLDVGSGPGTITVDFAARGLEVTAVENTEDAIELTRAEAQREGVSVRCVVSDVHALDFDDDSFDVVHAHQVIQHVHDPVAALREMRRVCRPGGLVAVRDSDYHGFVWAPADPLLTRWLELYDRGARARGGEPDAGRHLLRWAHEAGFEQVTAGSSTWCYATEDSRAWWGGMWGDRILQSALAHQLVEQGWSDTDELAAISRAWLHWAADPHGWFSLVHGEIIAVA